MCGKIKVLQPYLLPYSYSLFEPNSRTLAEYGVSLEKAILRDSELLSEVNNAFCNSHPLLAQKVVTRSACAAVSKIGADTLVSKALSVRRAKAGSLLNTIQEVNALKLEENDILVRHGYHTAGSLPPWPLDAVLPPLSSATSSSSSAAPTPTSSSSRAAPTPTTSSRELPPPPAAAELPERKRYRRGHRTTTTTQRYVMACCIALALKSYRKMCMQHVYSTHLRDLPFTSHVKHAW